MSNPETKIQNEIRIALSKHDCTVFRANVGKVMMNNGRWFDTGLPKGHPDLYGFRHSDGKCFYVEVKTKTGRLDEIWRARENKATIVNTNLAGSTLKKNYGDRVMSRFGKNGMSYAFKNIQDYRSKKQV